MMRWYEYVCEEYVSIKISYGAVYVRNGVLNVCYVCANDASEWENIPLHIRPQNGGWHILFTLNSSFSLRRYLSLNIISSFYT